jgi:hypothetical protein
MTHVEILDAVTSVKVVWIWGRSHRLVIRRRLWLGR